MERWDDVGEEVEHGGAYGSSGEEGGWRGPQLQLLSMVADEVNCKATNPYDGGRQRHEGRSQQEW